MVNSKKGNVVQMLSPENYIRKKARSLPIYECLVRSDWNESKMATVIITRSHTNGNITGCSYLVDLACLGVKDTMYLFNVPIQKYEEFKNMVHGGMEMIEVDYVLAHNIVYAGVEFAEEYGFKPNKVYESVTKYMLEEDSEEIELIEIECGDDGKPVYTRGPFEDEANARRIVAQLEKTVGPGNYIYMDRYDEFKAKDEFENAANQFDDLDDDLDDEFDDAEKTFEEKRELFLSLLQDMDDLSELDSRRFINLIDLLADDLVNEEKYDQIHLQLMEELNFEIDQHEIPNQLLGLKPGDQEVTEDLKERFISIYQMITFNPKLAEKELKLFQKQPNGIPGACYLELHTLQIKESSKYIKRLSEYAKTYPDYALIQLLWAGENMTSSKHQQNPKGTPFNLKTFFPDRETIHPLERYYALQLYAFYTGIDLDINIIQAFTSIVYDLDLPKNEEKLLMTIITTTQLAYLVTYFKE